MHKQIQFIKYSEIWSLESTAKTVVMEGLWKYICIDDQWHEAICNAKVASNSQSSQDISIQVDSTSMMVVLSEQSIPNDKINSNSLLVQLIVYNISTI